MVVATPSGATLRNAEVVEVGAQAGLVHARLADQKHLWLYELHDKITSPLVPRMVPGDPPQGKADYSSCRSDCKAASGKL